MDATAWDCPADEVAVSLLFMLTGFASYILGGIMATLVYLDGDAAAADPHLHRVTPPPDEALRLVGLKGEPAGRRGRAAGRQSSLRSAPDAAGSPPGGAPEPTSGAADRERATAQRA